MGVGLEVWVEVRVLVLKAKAAHSKVARSRLAAATGALRTILWTSMRRR